MKNILITSAGRRVSLVRSFQKELKQIFPTSSIFTTDANPEWSSACRISDKYFTLPKVDDPNYIKELLSICIQNNVKVIVPTIDTELELLSKNKNLFTNYSINIIVSDFELVTNCRDKRKSNLIFSNLGIRVPEIMDKNDLKFPLFIKPYDGSLGKDIYLIRGKDELTDSLLNNPKLIFNEYIDKSKYFEFSIDAYFDKKNNLKCLVPRNRIEIRGGEISKGRTEKNGFYDILLEKFKYLKGAIGCLTIQIFIEKSKNELIGIEINPRFGGGYPLSYEAGANYPKFIIKEYLLEESIPFFDDWIENKVMLRFDSEIILDSNDFTH